MNDTDRVKLLHGPYRAPRCRLGKTLCCKVKGEVPVTRISAGPIPWPMTTKRGGKPSMILCGDLVKAVRRESVLAVCHWWGVGRCTVWEWRQILGVGATNEGTSRLRHDYAL